MNEIVSFTNIAVGMLVQTVPMAEVANSSQYAVGSEEKKEEEKEVVKEATWAKRPQALPRGSSPCTLKARQSQHQQKRRMEKPTMEIRSATDKNRQTKKQ